MAFEMDRDDEYMNEEDVKIVVFGVGGGGGNTIATMVENNIGGVHYAIANTNTKDLDKQDKSKITTIHLSKKTAEQPARTNERTVKRRNRVVRGAGGNPKMGEDCANDTLDAIIAEIEDADMVFVAAGMGGGTGTGAAPVIAKAAKDMGILTVGVTTKPFEYEGATRLKIALDGIQKMRECVDALIVIDDEKVFELPGNEQLPTDKVFKAVDDVLIKAVVGIIDIIEADGFINVDFADVCAALEDAGLAHMAIGHGKGEHAREIAVDQVLNSPLLETTIDGAKRGLINISIPRSFPINEYQQLACEIANRFSADAFFKVGVVFDGNLDEDEINIVAIATDFDEEVVEKVINESYKKLSNPSYGFPTFTPKGSTGSSASAGFNILSANPDDPNRANNLMNALNAINNSKNR